MPPDPFDPITESQLIPEFCRGRALTMLIIAMELVACILTLAGSAPWDALPLRLVLLSLYLQWIGLSCAAVLCLARRWLHVARVGVVFFSCWAMLVLVVLVISAGAWTFLQADGLGFDGHLSRGEFLLRNVGIGALVSLLLLRYFWERNQWLEQNRAQSEARYTALQSRMHPHFLFNTLNSLAALIGKQPQAAETMVEDLADLLRVSLDEQPRLVTLSEELETVRIYLRIEAIRLGDRLQVDFDIPGALMRQRIPRLTLQPLVENAVLHGISQRRDGGLVRISGHIEHGVLLLEVRNPLPAEGAAKTTGRGLALHNIAQRLQLIYGNRAALSLQAEPADIPPCFRARLRLPTDECDDAEPVPVSTEAAQR